MTSNPMGENQAKSETTAEEEGCTSSAFETYFAQIRPPKVRGGIRYQANTIPNIVNDLKKLGSRVLDYEIEVEAYRAYFRQAGYPDRYPEYYSFNLPEKSLEHFIAAELLEIRPGDIYIDIASENSPVPEIYHRLFGAIAYRQDLSYPPGLHGSRIGGDAANMPIPGEFASKMALHCSFEHFEGDADIRFIHEVQRVLKPGGAVCILPFYMFETYAIQTDPEVSVPAGVHFDADAVLYCKPGWQNRHARFYDPQVTQARIFDRLGALQVQVYWIQNFKQVDPTCYVHLALLIRKPA